MPRVGNYTDEETRTVLDHFIVPKECASHLFPTDLRPDWVSDFLRDNVKKTFSAGPIRRATDVVRFYALRDRTPDLVDFFTRTEKTQNDIERACHLIVTLCELGTPDQQQAAAKEFERLVASSAAAEGLEALVTTFFSLPPRAPSTAIKKRIADLRTECERKGPPEKLGDLMEYDIRMLPGVISAKAQKDSILTLPPGPPRLQRWAEAYLAYDSTTSFAWDRHAGFALVQDGRSQGDKPAAEALIQAMKKIDPKKDDPEVTKFRKTRGYRAREFFMEKLSEAQKDDAQDHVRVQEDLVQ